MQFSRIRFLGCTRFRARQNHYQLLPCLLWPAGRLAHANPVRHVRDEFPVQAACFRRDLPPVVGFPHLRVLRSIRLPSRIRWAFPVTVLLHLPAPWFTATLRFQHCSVSGFPLPCLKSCRPYTVVFHGQERLGPPKFFDASLPACRGLRTPADLPLLAKTEVRVLPSGAFKPSASAKPFRSCTSTAGCAVTPAASRIRCLRFAHLVRRVSTTPPWAQDSLRVDGYSLPDRDFHPARDAKLILARERQASGAANSRSEARADAVCRHLHAFVLSLGCVGIPPARPQRAVDLYYCDSINRLVKFILINLVYEIFLLSLVCIQSSERLLPHASVRRTTISALSVEN